MQPGRTSETARATTTRSWAVLDSGFLWLTTIFLAALWRIVQKMGTSPHVWIDTLHENEFVRQCLAHDQCTIVGPGATAGIFHSAGYLHWRALLEWLGLDANGAYVTLLVMNAFGVALVALAAHRLAGRVAGAFAAMLMVGSIGFATQLNVITDVAPLPFLGAVFLLVALAATSRPSLGMTALLGVVGGVMANVYATCLLCGLSAVWIACLLPDRRWVHAAVAALSFALTTFAIAPATWIIDASILLTHGVVGNASVTSSRGLSAIGMARLMKWATAAWVIAAAGRFSLRKRLDVPFAIFLPLYAPLVLGSWVGRLDPQDKYGAHVIAAVTVAIAVSFVVGIRALWQWIVELAPQLAILPSKAKLATRFAPYAAAAMMVLDSGRPPVSQTDQGAMPFTFRDLTSVQQILTRERGWDRLTAARNLRVSDDIIRQGALRWAPGWPATGKGNDLERAYLLITPKTLVPATLPANWVIANSSGQDATLLAFACSWIDWRSFRVCVTGAGDSTDRCTQSGLPTESLGSEGEASQVPGMPSSNALNLARQVMTLHLPLKPRAECPEEWVYMPRLPLACRGRIVGIDGGGAELDPSGNWAKLKQEAFAATAQASEITITWELGGSGCQTQYRGYPPFFVEGDPATVTLLRELLAHDELRS